MSSHRSPNRKTAATSREIAAFPSSLTWVNSCDRGVGTTSTNLSATGLLSMDVWPGGKSARIPSRFGRFSETVTARLLGTMLVLLVAALALGAWRLQRKASARAESAINDRYAHEAIGRVDQFVREEGRWPRS
jgi:hypothetical protein